MPRTFGQIQFEFWYDAEMNAQPLAERMLAAFFISGIHTNSLGIYRCPLESLPFDIHRPREETEKAFVRLIDMGFISYCELTGYVWVKKYLKHNWPKTVKQKKGILNLIEALPNGIRFRHELQSIVNLMNDSTSVWPEDTHSNTNRVPIDTHSNGTRYIERDIERDIESEREIEKDIEIESREKIEDKEKDTEIDSESKKPSSSESLSRPIGNCPIGPSKSYEKFIEVKDLEDFVKNAGLEFNLGRRVSETTQGLLPITAEEVGLALADLKASENPSAHPINHINEYVKFNR